MCPLRFLFLAVPNEETVSQLFRKVLELLSLIVLRQSITHRIGRDWSSITPATKKMKKKLVHILFSGKNNNIKEDNCHSK